ncbi:MAG: mechanosensitive ion channel family protein [Candidatus Saccharimonadales bacterium]
MTSIFNNVVAQIMSIVVVAALLHHVSGKVIAYLAPRFIVKNHFESETDLKKRQDTIMNVFRTSAGLFIWVIATTIILSLLHVNLASIAAGAGFLGIVVGLGAQTTIRDYLAGMFILLENQYRVGDIVTLSGGTTGLGTSGVVEEITLRITKLRDLDGTLNVIRNGEASVVTNRTFDYSSVMFDIGVAYDSDIDLVEKVINQVGQDMLEEEKLKAEIIEPISFFRIDKFAPSAVMVKVVGKVKPAKQWDMAGEYRRRILKAFKKADIEIAFPQIVVHQKK